MVATIEMHAFHIWQAGGAEAGERLLASELRDECVKLGTKIGASYTAAAAVRAHVEMTARLMDAAIQAPTHCPPIPKPTPPHHSTSPHPRSHIHITPPTPSSRP